VKKLSRFATLAGIILSIPSFGAPATLLDLVDAKDISGLKKYFAQGGSPNVQDRDGGNAFTHLTWFDDELSDSKPWLNWGTSPQNRCATEQIEDPNTGERNFISERSNQIFDLLVAAGANANMILDPVDENESAIVPQHITAFIQAIRMGTICKMRKLIKSGLGIKQKDLNGEGPLHAAARAANVEILKYLLQFSAFANQINSVSQQGYTALDLIAFSSNPAEDDGTVTYDGGDFGVTQTHIIQDLIKAGANVNHRMRATESYPANEGVTPLMVAAQGASQGSVRALIKAGAEINAQSQSGETALMRAAMSRNILAMQKLITAGAKLNLQDDLGNTALHYATLWTANYGIERSPSSVIDLLIRSGINRSLKNKEGQSAYDLAAANGGSDGGSGPSLSNELLAHLKPTAGRF
jgi:ankyrin repeat protein